MAENKPNPAGDTLPLAMNGRLIRFIDSFLGIPLIRLISLLRQVRKNGNPVTPPKRILLVKFWGIGNLFMLLPTIHALQSTFPDSVVDFLTLRHNRDALATTGAVNEIVAIDIRTPRKFLRSWHAVASELRGRHYDLIIDFEQFARFSALLTWQIGAARSIGFKTKGQHRHHLYTDSVPYDNEIHITRSFYTLAEESGVSHPFSPSVAFPSAEMLKAKGQGILKDRGISPSTPVAVMHVGTSENFMERRWEPVRYAELAELLIERFGFRIILTGLPEEAHLTRTAAENIRQSGMMHDLGGKLSFTGYFALIASSDLVISADTAAVHLASAANIPVAGLYGPNTPRLYGPWGEGGLALYAEFRCSPCITNFNGKLNTCRHPDGSGACMNALSVEEVFTAIERTYCLPDAPCRLAKFAGTESEPCVA